MDNSKPNEEVLTWVLPQYKHIEKNIDWFWALGVIVLCGGATSIIYKNYFFAVLLLLGGLLMAYFATRKPELVDFKLDDKGLNIKNRLYPYENIKAFWVQTPSQENGMESSLFIHSERYILPTISLPIYQNMGDRIRERMLSKNVPEEKMEEHLSVAIMDFLGF
ncbi:MAG: hypothetical protein AAB438_02565 [Patescibacteria group bacterium]